MAAKVYQGLAKREPVLDYHTSAYLALAYELELEPRPDAFTGIFTQFAKAIHLAEDEDLEGARDVAKQLLQSDQTVWAQYMGLNILASTGSEDRQAIAEACLANKPLNRCMAIEQWIYDLLIPYHANSILREDVEKF
jgi:hypothetical protein